MEDLKRQNRRGVAEAPENQEDTKVWKTDREGTGFWGCLC